MNLFYQSGEPHVIWCGKRKMSVSEAIELSHQIQKLLEEKLTSTNKQSTPCHNSDPVYGTAEYYAKYPLYDVER